VAYYFDYILPSYNIANARVSLEHDNWSANVFVDNFTNKVALMTANNTSFQFNIPQLVRYSTNQPRTVGVQVNYKVLQPSITCSGEPRLMPSWSRPPAIRSADPASSTM
jgi:hypothetical protein